MNEQITKLVEAAILAPSGENAQPWRFKISGNQILLFNDPTSDQSLYNYKQYGSLVSQGAAIENMLIAAQSLHIKLDIDYFPDDSNKDLVAKITVSSDDSEPKEENLYSHIPKRCTNRKMYEKTVLSDQQIKTLSSVDLKSGNCVVKFITDESVIKDLATFLSANEQIIFENKYLHDFFYHHIRWTKEEEAHDNTGFFIDTLELNEKQRKGFKMFKNWFVLNILNKLAGASRLVAKDNEANYASASAIGAILFDSPEDKDYVLTGQIFEKIWLEATKMGLSMQPATGVLFLNQRLKSSQEKMLNEKQRDIILNAYKRISNAFSSNGKTVMMLFRIGKGGEPTARALRKPIESFILK